eukprot:UN27861
MSFCCCLFFLTNVYDIALVEGNTSFPARFYKKSANGLKNTRNRSPCDFLHCKKSVACISSHKTFFAHTGSEFTAFPLSCIFRNTRFLLFV